MFPGDEELMGLALAEAELAAAAGEVPVGACIVDADGSLLARSANRTIGLHDPTAHAEILAIRAAGLAIGNYRLVGTTLYTTVEPCVMCAGAIVNARVKRLVYGTRDERFGGVETLFRLCDSPVLNHRVEIVSGVRGENCRELMQRFFRARR